MSTRILATNASWALLYHLLSRGSLMLAAILLARRFETSSFAAFNYFRLTIAILAGYAAMGLGVAASRFFAEFGHRADGGKASLLGTLWALSVCFALVGFVTVLLIPDPWLTAGLAVPRQLLALGVLVLALKIVPSGAILGLERYRQATLVAGAAATITLVGAFWAARVDDARLAMGAIIASTLFQAVGEAFVVIRTVGWRTIAEGLSLQKTRVRRVLGLSGPMFLVSLLSASGGWLVGRIILGGPGSEHAFALFSIGLQWFALALIPSGMLSRVLLPRLVRSTADASGTAASRRLVRAAIGIASGAATAIALTGLLLGPWIIGVYGDNYQSSKWLIPAYLAAGVVCAPAAQLGSVLVAHDGQWHWLGLTILWSVVLIGSAFAFRAEISWGGAATYAVAYAALSVGALLVARRESLV